MNSRAKPKKNAKFKKRQRQSKTITFEEFVADKGNFVKVRGWARDGLTNDMIADKIGIVSSTLYAWQNRSKEFKEALKKGKEIIDREVEDSLLKRALGTKKSKTIYRMVKVSDEVLKAKRLKFMNIYKLDHPEASRSEIVFEAYDKVSEWTKIPFQVEEEEIVGDVKAMEFWLRNRKPEQFRDKAFNRLNNAQADKMKAEIKRNEAQTEYLNKKTAALSAENQDIIFENDYAEPDEVEGVLLKMMTNSNARVISLKNVMGKGYSRFFNSRAFYRVVRGSRGSKKSKTAAISYIHDILKYSWANVLVVRRYSNTNRQSTFTDLRWAAKRLGVESQFKFDKGMPEITVKKTGQKIIFRGLDDELKITSISVDTGILSWCWFEECYQVESEKKFDTVVESIRGSYDAEDFFKQITVTFNPWNSQHWLKKKFFDEKTRVKDVFAMRSTFRCNEWLDDKDKERLEDIYRTNPRRARVVCDGEWGIAEGLVYEDNFSVYDFTDEEIASLPKYHGMDFGFKHDPTAVANIAVNMSKKIIYVYSEIYQQHMLTQDIYNALTKNGLQKKIIRADSENQRLIAELKNKGCSGIRASIKGKNSIIFGINFLQGFKIYVRSSCKNAINEFNMYSYKQDKNGQWLNEPEDKFNHFLDALRYAVEPLTFIKKKGISQDEQKKALTEMGL